MTEPPEIPEGDNPEDYAKFSVYRRPGSAYRTIHIQYQGVVVKLGYLHTPEGLLSASHFASSFKDVWIEAQREMGITDAMSDLDSELDELLARDGDEE